MLRLKDKICLITGGTQSIGAGIASLFYQEGAIVVITGRRNNKTGEKIARNIHPHIHYVKLDVSLEDDWHMAMTYIEKHFGRLDVLVNNAGIEQPSDSPHKQNPEYCTLEDWQMVNRVNLDGVFLGCKHAISLMKKSLQGSIINMGSRSALVGVPSSAAYSASKAAIRNYTKTVAMYSATRNYGIRCNVIHPAAILTSLWDKEFGVDDERPLRIRAFEQNIPLKRMGTVEDIAYAALYLASDESRYLTGTEIIVDGGIMAGSAASAEEEVINLRSHACVN